MRDNVLAKILRYLIYAAAFMPLVIFNDYISPFHFGKVVIFRSIVEIALGIYLLLIWKDRSYLPKINKIGWAFLAFAIAFSITTATSIIPYISFWGSLERMGGVFTFWHYFVFFIILTSVFRSEKDWLMLLNITIGVGILSALYGFGQRTNIEFFVGSGGRERIFGTIGNPALFAGYQILTLYLALTLFFHPKASKNYKIFYASGIILNTIAVLMTAVRGSILAIGIGYIIFALLYSSVYRSKKAKKILLGLIGLVFVFVVCALLFKNTSFVQNSRYLKRVTAFNLSDYTVQTRFWAWQAGIEGWKETPKTILLGWGPENFNIPFSKHFNPKFFRGPGSETLFDRAHNMFVEVLVTMGMVGILSYLSIFAVSLKVLWGKLNSNNSENIYAIGFIPLIIAYAIHNSFIFDTSANFLVFFTILGFLSFIIIPKETREKEVKLKPAKVNSGLFFIGAAIIFVVIGATVYNINVLPSIANYTTTRAIIAGWAGDFNGAVGKYKEALGYDVAGKYEIRNRFAQYVLEQTNSGKLDQAKTDAVNDAIIAVQKNLDENKPDYLPYLYISRLYITLGKEDPKSQYNDKALEYSLAALDIAPKFVRTYYEIGQAYLNKEDFPKAAEYFQKAAELNPDVGLSFWYWGVVEVQMGNLKTGLDIIEGAIESGKYVPSENDMSRLISLYADQNNIPRLIWAHGILVNIKPDNAQYHASFAVAYARGGQIDNAIKEAKKAAELDPNFESEARSFVQSLGRQW